MGKISKALEKSRSEKGDFSTEAVDPVNEIFGLSKTKVAKPKNDVKSASIPSSAKNETKSKVLKTQKPQAPKISEKPVKDRYDRRSQKVIDQPKSKAVDSTTTHVLSISKDTDAKIVKQVATTDFVDHRLVTLKNPKSFEAEQFKILRTNLLFSSTRNKPRTIMVTSSVPDEGKTFVCANLAVSIAQNINEHVLLLDCDMRRPSIHKYFGFEDTPGLTDYLSGISGLPSLLLKTNLEKLTLLPGGKPPHNPSELLSSQRMTDLLKEVKDRYNDRCILIDSPPPMIAAETKAIGHQVDGILLVVKQGSTDRQLVSETLEQFEREKLLGTVINQFNINTSKYYSYGYNKGYLHYN